MSNDPTDRSPEKDLDQLIGELETEAARRRAAPDYPHDADAQLHFELARRAPVHHDGTSLRAMAVEVEAAVDAFGDSARNGRTGGGGGVRGRWPRSMAGPTSGDPEPVTTPIGALGLALGEALRAAADQIEQLQARLGVLEAALGFGAEPGGAGGEVPAADAITTLDRWKDRLLEPLAAVSGRVLYADTQSEVVVDALRSAGIDAYAVTLAGERFAPGPDVRHDEVLKHLRSVPDGALAAAVLVGPPEAVGPRTLGALVGELARTARLVVVVSEAPWWWRRRLGAARADVSMVGPVEPDTWLDAMQEVGLVGSAEYDADGHSFRVVARATS